MLIEKRGKLRAGVCCQRGTGSENNNICIQGPERKQNVRQTKKRRRATRYLVKKPSVKILTFVRFEIKKPFL